VERAAKAGDLTTVRRMHGIFLQEVQNVADQAGLLVDGD